MNTVQQVELKDYKRAAACLAAAFQEDPITLYFCQHPHTTSEEVVKARNGYFFQMRSSFDDLEL